MSRRQGARRKAVAHARRRLQWVIRGRVVLLVFQLSLLSLLDVYTRAKRAAILKMTAWELRGACTRPGSRRSAICQRPTRRQLRARARNQILAIGRRPDSVRAPRSHY